MLNDHVFQLCTLCAILSGTFVYLVSPARIRARRLGKALQGLSERYATEVQRATAERQEWGGERVVLKGVINADTERAEKLLKTIEDMRARKQRAFNGVVQAQESLITAWDKIGHLANNYSDSMGTVARHIKDCRASLIIVRRLCE